ncbi:MAG: hypothetical protein COZ68_10765 [Deltaproteobacteria bacterium CG_4_8_14_3_um_filter_43_13]|nr:MAG: hypothetical protein COZ68_10765 [Deltaproteobacteria bacterium CG_4_8_14_3_um_filter_43_13]
MRQLSSAPEGQSVSNSWFSPQRSGGEVQEFAAQLPHSPRAERGENDEVTGRCEAQRITGPVN